MPAAGGAAVGRPALGCGADPPAGRDAGGTGLGGFKAAGWLCQPRGVPPHAGTCSRSWLRSSGLTFSSLVS